MAAEDLFDTIFPHDVEEEFQLCEKDYMGQNLDETLSVSEQGDSSDEADRLVDSGGC